MSAKPNTVFIMMPPLRALSEWNAEHEMFLATCLQTGHIVTADTIEMAEEMIVELLSDEVNHMLLTANLRNLLNNPADIATWVRYAINTAEPNVTFVRSWNLHPRIRMMVGNFDIGTEIQVRRAGRTEEG